MIRNLKYGLIAVCLGIILSLTPYLTISLITSGSVFSKGQSFFDDFISQDLNSMWTFVDPLGGSSLDLTSQRSWLIITASHLDSDISAGPRVVLSGITGDFNITTKVQVPTTNGNGSAGIIVWESTNKYIYLHEALTLTGPSNPSMTNIVIFEGERFYISPDLRFPSSVPIDLMLERKGDNFTASFIARGVEYPLPPVEQYSFDGPVDVGISATCTGGNFSGYFDLVSFASTG